MRMIGSVMDRLADRIEEVEEVMDSTNNDMVKAEFIVKLVHEIENECIIDDMTDNAYYKQTKDIVYGG